jgi:hypothetical protein
MSANIKKITFQEKYQCRWMSFLLFLIAFLSLLITLTIILGNLNGKIFLDKLNFEENSSKQVKSITYTMFGYCINNNCTSNLLYDFDIGK